MAVHALTTAVNNLVTRVITLQPLAIAQVTPNTVSKKMWYWNSPTAPFWGNRPGGLRHLQRRDQWELTIVSRLWLSSMDGSTIGTTPPQELSFQYITETLSYFEAVRTTLAPTGYAEIAYLDSAGITITCQRGEDFAMNPGVSRDDVYIEFVLTAPFHLVGA